MTAYVVYAFGDNPNPQDPALVPEGLRGPLPHPDNHKPPMKTQQDWLGRRAGLVVTED